MSQTMMWVFAVLIVLAMGVIAMLAAGHGEPMAPAYDDRPDALVPADRPIGAADLRRVRFSLALRGYRMAEVDALLTRLADELELRDQRDRRDQPGGEAATAAGNAPEQGLETAAEKGAEERSGEGVAESP